MNRCGNGTRTRQHGPQTVQLARCTTSLSKLRRPVCQIHPMTARSVTPSCLMEDAPWRRPLPCPLRTALKSVYQRTYSHLALRAALLWSYRTSVQYWWLHLRLWLRDYSGDDFQHLKQPFPNNLFHGEQWKRRDRRRRPVRPAQAQFFQLWKPLCAARRTSPVFTQTHRT